MGSKETLAKAIGASRLGSLLSTGCYPCCKAGFEQWQTFDLREVLRDFPGEARVSVDRNDASKAGEKVLGIVVSPKRERVSLTSYPGTHGIWGVRAVGFDCFSNVNKVVA